MEEIPSRNKGGRRQGLNIDLKAAIGEMIVSVPLKEILKLPKQQKKIKNSLGFEEEELPEDLQNIHIHAHNRGHEPFMLTLVVNDLYLHNCMLDSGASANIMPLKFVK